MIWTVLLEILSLGEDLHGGGVCEYALLSVVIWAQGEPFLQCLEKESFHLGHPTVHTGYQPGSLSFRYHTPLIRREAIPSNRQ